MTLVKISEFNAMVALDLIFDSKFKQCFHCMQSLRKCIKLDDEVEDLTARIDKIRV